MQTAGTAPRNRANEDGGVASKGRPELAKTRSLVSVKSFAPERIKPANAAAGSSSPGPASPPPTDSDVVTDSWNIEGDKGEGVKFPLNTLSSMGSSGGEQSKAQLMWHTAYNKQRVAAAFTNQLVINRGLYGSRDAKERKIKGEKTDEVAIKYWTLSPYSSWKKWWDLAQVLFLTYVAIMVPYRVGFRDPAEGVSYWIETVIDAYFIADVMLNMVTGYVDDEGVPEVVMDFNRIVRNYMKVWFWVDVLAIIPVDVMIRHYEGRLGCSFAIAGCPEDVIVQSGNGTQTVISSGPNNSGQLVRLVKLLRLFRLLKLLRLVKVQRIFEKYQDDVFQMLPMLTLGKLLVMLLYLGHIIGCFYMFCSHPDFRTARENVEIEAGNREPWLMIEFGTDTAAEDASRTDRYVASMYWAFTTMTTVGYGDISAVTTAERASAIAGMIIGGFVFSYIIGTIAEVIANLDQSSRSHAKKMQSVSQFVRDNELPKNERKSVLNYFRMQSVRAYSDEVLLMEMPYQLRKTVVWFMFREIIDKVPFFYGEREHVKVEICSRFQTATYPPETLVYQRSEASSALFVVGTGEVEMSGGYAPGSVGGSTGGEHLATLKVGSYFGEELVCGHPLRTATVRCLPATKFHILDPADLLYLVEIFPTFQEQLIANFEKRNRKMMARSRADAPGPSSDSVDISVAPGGGKNNDEKAGGVNASSSDVALSELSAGYRVGAPPTRGVAGSAGGRAGPAMSQSKSVKKTKKVRISEEVDEARPGASIESEESGSEGAGGGDSGGGGRGGGGGLPPLDRVAESSAETSPAGSREMMVHHMSSPLKLPGEGREAGGGGGGGG